MFENEWFPKANAIGVSWKEFWETNPRILKLLVIGHEEKIREIDRLAWTFGQYVISSVTIAVEKNLAGKKARAKYIEKPILELMEEKEYERRNERKEYDGLSEEEKQKAELERAKEYFNSLAARF